MSYVANKYNYSTPLNSSVGLNSEASVVSDIKYFVLSDNVLDGSHYPISGDVGLWGAAASNADGTLTEPFVVTVTADSTINSFRLEGSQYNYPVAFTVQFYNGTSLLYTITETDNDSAVYVNHLPKTLVVTHFVISITKVSHPGSAARIYNVYNPAYVLRQDALQVHANEVGDARSTVPVNTVDALKVKTTESVVTVDRTIHSTDALRIKHASSTTVHASITSVDTVEVSEMSSAYIDNGITSTDVLTASDLACVTCNDSSHITNTIGGAADTFGVTLVTPRSAVTNIIDVTADTARVAASSAAKLTNVHTKMKEPSRRIYGKVYITYTDPMLDNDTTVSTNMEAYNSNKQQVIDGVYTSDNKLFTLYDNKLDGSSFLMDEYTQVGWVSGEASDANGAFSTVPYLRVDFEARAVMPFSLHFDTSHGCTAEDFTVEFIHAGESTVLSFVGNTEREVPINSESIMAEAIVVRVTKVTKPGFPVAILEIPLVSTVLYRGYSDVSDLMSIDILDELTYDDDVEALGGVSANEATIVLDNSHGAFYFNNDKSTSARMLRRNRRIEPWLGVEIVPGEIEWYKQGTFWSYRWNVPVGKLTATVVGFDTIGLLGTTSYENHYVYTNKSLGELITIVLSDAKEQLNFLSWQIDDALFDVIVPYAWFAPTSHAAALRKISTAYPMHIYCDKNGRICAAPQKLRLDYYHDIWSDSTNVFSKEYGSLFTTLPNIVNVAVHIPHEIINTELVRDDLAFDVSSVPTRKLNFSKPYIADIVVNIDKDASVSYTYTAYSWGIELSFTGTGVVRAISCYGTALDVSNTAVLTRRDSNGIRINGAITRDVDADFIQTSELAQVILDRIFSLSADDKYDVTVMYRGDIALSINDPILLLDGIAPDNRYNIRRHQLSWNGALTGIADLNT